MSVDPTASHRRSRHRPRARAAGLLAPVLAGALVVAGFERAHPGVTVKTVGGISDDKIVAAIRGGNAPDIAQSFSTDNTGSFCGSGAWTDLGPRMKADGISTSQFPAAVQAYTKFA